MQTCYQAPQNSTAGDFGNPDSQVGFAKRTVLGGRILRFKAIVWAVREVVLRFKAKFVVDGAAGLAVDGEICADFWILDGVVPGR